MYQVYQYQKEDEQKIEFFHSNFVKVILKVIVQNKKLAATPRIIGLSNHSSANLEMYQVYQYIPERR